MDVEKISKCSQCGFLICDCESIAVEKPQESEEQRRTNELNRMITRVAGDHIDHDEAQAFLKERRKANIAEASLLGILAITLEEHKVFLQEVERLRRK